MTSTFTPQPFEERSIEGKVILFTGGSKGIGAYCVKQLAKRGATLLVVARAQKELEEFVEEAKKETNNQNIHGFVCDIGDIKSVSQLYEQVSAKFSHIDVLVNNASIMPGFGIEMEKVSDELDIATFRINVEGYYFVTKRFLPLLFNSKSEFERTVINVSSSAGWLTEPEIGLGAIGYKVSKAAENGLTVALHQTYVEENEQTKGVRQDKRLHRVVSLHPGFVQTGLGRETWHDKSQNDEQISSFKSGIGAIPLEEGCDTLLYLLLAKSGVESGKTYYQRKVHTF